MKMPTNCADWRNEYYADWALIELKELAEHIEDSPLCEFDGCRKVYSLWTSIVRRCNCMAAF